MHKMLTYAATAAMLVAAGCRVVEVENRGEGIVTDSDGNPILVNGAVQKYNRGWEVYHNQHWMWTKMDTMEAHIKPDDISFQMGGLNTAPSSNLVALVDTSTTGVANLATKIGAAIVTCGGSAAAESTASAVATLIEKYKAAGGNTSTATVTTSGNTITVSDGTASASAVCTDGTCTVK